MFFPLHQFSSATPVNIPMEAFFQHGVQVIVKVSYSSIFVMRDQIILFTEKRVISNTYKTTDFARLLFFYTYFHKTLLIWWGGGDGISKREKQRAFKDM